MGNTPPRGRNGMRRGTLRQYRTKTANELCTRLACIFSDVSYENSLKYDRYPMVVFAIPSKNLRRNTGTISVRYCPKQKIRSWKICVTFSE